MKRTIVQIFFFVWAFPAVAQYTVTSGNSSPLLAENNINGRIEVYLLNGLAGCGITFTSNNSGTHQWYKYNINANEAVAVSCNQTGNQSIITDIADGYGYFVGSPTDPSTRFVWIIDYSKYTPVFYNLSVDDESDDRCNYLKIITDAEAEPLQYYTPLGMKTSLTRIYHLAYTTMKWDEEAEIFIDESVNMPVKTVNEITIEAPLKDTNFTLSGDEFAEHFGMSKIIATNYKAIAVKAQAIHEQQKEYGDNEQKVAGDNLGGSAPVDILFKAYANEPVAAFYVWTINKIDAVTGNPNTIVRYPDKVLSYKFENSGSYIVGLEVIDSKSICVDTTQVFTVDIGETDIQIPNFFSPGSSIGSNDEFRISYKSITSFKCSIFNRWGNLLYQWNDPSKGWDGRVAGKFVPTGVYFYVIEYKGTDGKAKTKSGNINILRSKNE
ncbi:MAG: gliding motility-associated C-terminal domain-containing protein [Dysgonamonadaceae bacterium]|jgi:gliding motility-associated-like protein|nr:gliding motility-associated C-terminal domain-containing protein [Dysgonamonadaceae bacterium]